MNLSTRASPPPVEMYYRDGGRQIDGSPAALALKNETNASNLAALQQKVIEGDDIIGKRSVSGASKQHAVSADDVVCEIGVSLFIRGSDAKYGRFS